MHDKEKHLETIRWFPPPLGFSYASIFAQQQLVVRIGVVAASTAAEVADRCYTFRDGPDWNYLDNSASQRDVETQRPTYLSHKILIADYFGRAEQCVLERLNMKASTKQVLKSYENVFPAAN